MEEGSRTGWKGFLRSGRVRALIALAVVAVVVAVVVAQLPQRLEGRGTLDQCYWGWPVVKIDGGNDPYLPVASWPIGLTFDEAAGVLTDTSGHAVLNRGDRVVVTGVVIEVRGDPSPCFYTRGIKIESIERRVTEPHLRSAPP